MSLGTIAVLVVLAALVGTSIYKQLKARARAKLTGISPHCASCGGCSSCLQASSRAHSLNAYTQDTSTQSSGSRL